MEGLAEGDCLLASHGVSDKENMLRLHRLLQTAKLSHEDAIYLQPALGIKEDRAMTLPPRTCESRDRDLL